METKNIYDLKSVKLPYFSSGMLRLFVPLLEGPLSGLLMPSFFESAGFNWLRKQKFAETPTFYPIHFTGELQKESAAVDEKQWPAQALPGKGFRFSSILDFAKAYREGKTTPEEVAIKVLEAIDASNASSPPLRAVIAVHREEVIQQARESTERIRQGRAISLLDGVPVAIKDEMDVAGFPTRVGTSFLGTSPAEQDAEVVRRLRNAGVLIVGKTNMHEIGIDVTGLNPHFGTPRNPYNPDHFTGGSSSGSAAAVASGLVPVAIGADGGGSIRIPSAFCGLVGLKPTFRRVSEFGAFPLCDSLDYIGPLAGSATDAALAYAAIAGPDPKDPLSLLQSMPSLDGWDNVDLHGLKLGVYRPWFRHADPEIVTACESLLEQFTSLGAEICEVIIPDLEASRVAHTVTIMSEMARTMNAYHDHHRDHGLSERVTLAVARKLTATDYLISQHVRTRMMNHFDEIFKQVDMVITPATAVPAPVIRNGALPDGESDLTTTVEIMRFATVGNLTGLPAISFPAGYTANGLPIGMQAMGRAWQEALLLRLALAAEQIVEKKAPQVYYKILD